MATEDVPHFCPPPPSAFIHEQKCLCGGFAVSTIHPRNQEESFPPVHQIIGKETSVLSVDPLNWPVTGSSLPQLQAKAPGEHWDSRPWTREAWWASRFLEEKFQRSVGAKKWRNLDLLEWVKGTAWPYLNQPSCKVAQLWTRAHLSPGFFHGGEEEWVSEHPAFPAMLDAAQEVHFSAFLSRPI